MSIIQSLILGLVQGLTEFLPISSSGHLVLVPYYLKWNIPISEAFVFDVLVQIATLAAVCTFFIRDITKIASAMWLSITAKNIFYNQDAKIGWLLIIATLPAGFVGLLVKSLVKSAFDSPFIVGVFLLVTAILLFLAEIIGKRQRSLEEMTIKDAIWMGFFQALAIFPGISRSGATIAAGMMRGLNRQAAARFSFLMSIPIMAAAGLMSFLDLINSSVTLNQLIALSIGCLTAGIAGYLSISWLLKFLVNRSLYVFTIYCALVGIITIASMML